MALNDLWTTTPWVVPDPFTAFAFLAVCALVLAAYGLVELRSNRAGGKTYDAKQLVDNFALAGTGPVDRRWVPRSVRSSGGRLRRPMVGRPPRAPATRRGAVRGARGARLPVLGKGGHNDHAAI